jgi:serine/threonine protein kinase
LETLGTPEYMSPEQAEIDETAGIDWRADVYALGVVAYEMLVGRPPFIGKSATAILHKHVYEDPPKPTDLNPDLIPELEPILLEALQKERTERYQQAEIFAAELGRAFSATRMPQIPKYEVVERIGEGAFAIVYKAYQIGLGRPVALKVLRLPPEEGIEFTERFERFGREAEITGGLRHSNIVTVYETGQEADISYIAMEYLPGRTLAQIIEAEKRLPLEQALEILEQAADALDCAHDRQIVHRDIKPANIMVEGEPGKLHVTVMDFGLATAMEGSARLTRSHAILGTVAYMAPEQVNAKLWGEVTSLTDVYALGAVAYEMLTGCVPFGGELVDVLRSISDDPPPSPSEVNPDLDDELAQVLLKAINKSPQDRFQSVGDFVEELGSVARVMSLYEELRSAAETEDWLSVLTLGEMIHKEHLDYRDVRKWIKRAERKLSRAQAGAPWWIWVAMTVLAVALVASLVIAGPGILEHLRIARTSLPQTTSSPTSTTVLPASATASPTLRPTGTPVPIPSATATSTNTPTSAPTPTTTSTSTPTDTVTPTPTATETFTPSPTPMPRAIVIGEQGINLRAGPGTVYDDVGGVTQGGILIVLARTSDGSWLLVRYGDAQVWIYAGLVEVTPEVAVIPTASAIPPTPTKPPTSTPEPPTPTPETPTPTPGSPSRPKPTSTPDVPPTPG